MVKLSALTSLCLDRISSALSENLARDRISVSIRYLYPYPLILEVSNIFDEAYHNFLATSRGMVLKEAGIGVSLQYIVEF